MKREQSRILAVSAILAVSVARVIWRDSLAKIADTKIIGIDTHRDRDREIDKLYLNTLTPSTEADFHEGRAKSIQKIILKLFTKLYKIYSII